VITVITEKQRSMEGEEESARDDERTPAVHISSKKAYESSMEFVTSDHSDHSDHSRRNPDDMSGHLESLGDHSDHSRRNPRDRARLAGTEDECRWHLERGERVPRALCAGCRRPFVPGDLALDELADNNRVHFDADYRCLIAWGERWRSAARAALAQPERA
jgi:hypothetical protein